MRGATRESVTSQRIALIAAPLRSMHEKHEGWRGIWFWRDVSGFADPGVALDVLGVMVAKGEMEAREAVGGRMWRAAEASATTDEKASR